MKKISFAFIFLLFQFGCQNQSAAPPAENNNSFSLSQTSAQNPPVEFQKPKEENSAPPYAGVTIDQKFPIVEDRDFQDEEFKDKAYSVGADDFQISIKKFAPKTMSRNGKIVFSFKTLTPDDYWSSLIGVSHLLGENSKEIYVVATGPSGVCCTNYWITDVSSGKPRNVFRSEDFGRFREPMEVFDADGDGVLELVQFDSAFRYFMGDCGACSPEPRAVFKYDKSAGAYLPAKGIQQDFVKESLDKTEKQLAETFEELKTNEDIGKEFDFKQNALFYIVDLFYLGEERKAWTSFDKYYSDYAEKEEIRAEIKKRLKQSKFYQALKKTK